MSQSALAPTPPRGPSKPPLRNSINILSSIPNSSQLANIANAALHNIMNIPATPPPPPALPFELQSIEINPNRTRLPPGLPLPAAYRNSLNAMNPLIGASPDPVMANSFLRKRKRGIKKNNKETFEDTAAQIDEAKRNLINAIELERRNHELTKIRLVQLHKHYGNMLSSLKQESVYLMNKIKVLNNGPSPNDLEAILQQKQGLRDEYLRKRKLRLNDEAQLKQTNQENQKLIIIIHYLKQELSGLLTQYQALCAKQIQDDNMTEYSDAQKIVNNLDSLDIVDAESMVNREKNTINAMLQSPSTSNAVAQRINNDPWFHKIIQENQRLERHIRFLRHIIERETQRCNFKELIVGKRLPQSQVKKYEEIQDKK